MLGVGSWLLDVHSLLAQGPLTPPGAPAPTMKTLDQIEPRKAVQSLMGDADSLYIITSPGSYYLTANITGTSGKNGIKIASSDVTLDLNGFELVGGAGSLDGIVFGANTYFNCVIRNGTLRLWGGDAVDAANTNARIENIMAQFHPGRGIVAGDDSTVTCCKITSTPTGITTGRRCIVRDCIAAGCGIGIAVDDGSIISHCTASNGAGPYGILAGSGSTLTDCTASYNTGSVGISASYSSILTNCTAFGNHSDFGISVNSGSTLVNCSASFNSRDNATTAGIATGTGCTITHCTAITNVSMAGTTTPTTGMGFFVGSGSTIQNCTARLNQGDGIYIISETVVRENTCSTNGNGGDGAGIHITGQENRIEANSVTNNDRGIEANAIRNFIARNTARLNTLNYVIVAGNRIAQIVVPAVNAADINGANSGSGDGFTNLDPWANFSY